MAQKTDKPLNERQKQFAILIASGLPAARAYIEAGYKTKSEDNASSMASHLRKDPRVSQLILTLSQENTAKLQTQIQSETKYRIMNRLERQAFWTQVALDYDQPIGARLKATELLGKSEGDFFENVNISTPPTFKDDVE